MHSDDIRHVHTPFVRCKKYGYAARLTAIINQCYSLSCDYLPVSGLYYICSVQAYHKTYFFDNQR